MRERWGASLVGAGGVVAHLGDPQAAFLVEPNCDRADDVGLVRDELDFEAGIDFDLFERFFGRGGGRGGGAIGGTDAACADRRKCTGNGSKNAGESSDIY